jgi:hypothetical protein
LNILKINQKNDIYIINQQNKLDELVESSLFFYTFFLNLVLMKINLTDSSKDPSLKSLHQIMLEVAEDAREEQKQIVLSIEKVIQLQLAKMQKEYRFKK